MLINRVAYEHGRKLADIPIEAIDDFLRRPGCFVWSRCAMPPTPNCARCSMSELHELAVEDVDATATSGRRSRSTARRCSS